MDNARPLDPPAPLRTAAGGIDFDRYRERAHRERAAAVQRMAGDAGRALRALFAPVRAVPGRSPAGRAPRLA